MTGPLVVRDFRSNGVLVFFVVINKLFLLPPGNFIARVKQGNKKQLVLAATKYIQGKYQVTYLKILVGMEGEESNHWQHIQTES